MPDVYKVIARNDRFAAFWKADEDTLMLFVPSNPFEQYIRCNLSDWRSINYDRIEHQLDLYNDTINAAWHFLGLNQVFVDKSKVELSSIEPGTYYPRIWRGFVSEHSSEIFNAVNPRLEYGSKHVQAATAASSLFDYLVEIFRHVEPSAVNFEAFGHKIRELLILVCTEIEAGWRGILTENGYTQSARLSTKDYAKLLVPLRLKLWEVTLKEYPDLDPIVPFETWDASAPTQSLFWYDAYNAAKHNREAEFPKATLKNLLNAAAALHIMQAAQWGPEIFSLIHDNRFSPFEIAKLPAFDAAEIYVPALDESDALTPIHFFEAQS